MSKKRNKKQRSLLSRSVRNRLSPSERSRRLNHESLEKRELLAGDIDGAPRLVGVTPNELGIFSEDKLNRIQVAPSELTFSFDGGSQLDLATLKQGIKITRAGGDGSFAEGNEQVIIPGFLGFKDDQNHTVVARFAENLPDDRYRIELFGEDDPANNITAIKNTIGIPFCTIDGNSYQSIDFDVEIGGKVIAVVPQPIIAKDGQLIREGRKIDVYFDDPDLFRNGTNITNPDFYQLINTNGTATTEDDFPFGPIPGSVTMDPVTMKVTLEFASDLENLVPGATTTSFRLRIGDNANFETRKVTPFTPFNEPGVTIGAGDATDLTTVANANMVAGNWTLLIDQSIENGTLRALADNPGALDEISHRDIEVEQHFTSPGSIDSDNAITVIPYTFLKNQVYGLDINGNPLINQMNEAQETRFREILELYGELVGIDFVETQSAGLRLIVGDLYTADPTRVSGPGGILGLGGPGGVTMDFADYTSASSNVFGGGFYETALHEIGHALGLGHAYDLVGATMGSGGADSVYPGPHDLTHMEFLHQKESIDVDMYKFVLSEPGKITAQTIAERLVDASNLDTRLTLFQQDTSTGRVKLVSANDDYFGSDSFLEFELEPGTYFIGVAAEGNNSFNPESSLSSPGGVSEGAYNLRLEFQSSATINTLIDADGSALDGDRDGVAGGNYNFWFEAARAIDTLYVRKPDIGSDVGGTGTLAAPFDNISDALAVAATKSNAVVRVLANDGPDNNVMTLGDNEAYEIGFVPGINVTLDDGRNLIVPKNTTLVVDAGAILKFLDSRLSVGSDDDNVNRSGSSIQILGTPQSPVYFTSYNDHTKGANSNPNVNTPQRGNWGGIEIRNDVDRVQGRGDAELSGIFQNYINHAQIEFGGGQVSTIGRVVDPVHLSEARAEVSYNTIRDNADYAISADPDTFEVTSFASPRFQRSSVSGNGFVADYDRVGPDVHGNMIVQNSNNGMFIRIDTLANSRLESLNVSARFDDTDVVHILAENLTIKGRPGGTYFEENRPVPILGLSETTGGSISAGVYNYVYTFVDKNGVESLTSAPQSVITTGTNKAISFTGIEAATGDFVARRLYRSKNGSPFALVAELDKSTSVYVDRILSPSTSAPIADVISATKYRGRPDAGLVIDPGTIVKANRSRIELDYGTSLIAEGNEGREIIFTSQSDDRYGTGGTFDSNNDAVAATGAPGRTPLAGDWAGIYGNRTSRLSVDYAVLAYGGGVTGVEGSTAGINVIEVHQANARIANSLFEENANGRGGAGGNRQGLMQNAEATIFVEGSQPIIVGNTFIDNVGSVISIDVDAMNATLKNDTGRQTGSIDLYDIPPRNHGPVIRGNELENNTTNGMDIRGGTLTTEVVWDDTDIVHVLRSSIVVTNFHTTNGLRLQSSESESLVVKLSGANTELLATGDAFDITDRVGGRIAVLGTPGHPVILTSLQDSTVGAGFTPTGVWQTNTVGSGTPAPGNWRGITLDPYSHDRNVDTVTELEGDIGGEGDTNAVIGAHQDLGQIAKDEYSGDENVRLGFTVFGSLSENRDQDLYKFTGTAGTMLWIDIDRTDAGLDTVLEFLDGDGNVLALSDNSRDESMTGSLTYVNPRDLASGDAIGFDAGHALPMPLDSDTRFNAQGGGNRDFYSTNDGDSAMRVVLTGVAGSTGQFYVRVRSANPANLSDPAQISSTLTDGRTHGGYQLQIRLQETDEISGSVIRYSDIRYATSAINVIGLPAHTPLAGEVYNPGGRIVLGNLAESDRGAISGSGFLFENPGDARNDAYQFTVNRPGLQNAPGGLGATSTDHKISATIDIDWADGLQRPNTGAYLYHDGTLVAIGTDSNILDDQITPRIPNQTTNPNPLANGSLGVKDAFIGPLELSSEGTYQVVVTSNTAIPLELRQFTDLNPPNSLVRLEPLDSAIRIADDRFDTANSPTPSSDQGPIALQVAFEDNGSNISPTHFGDIPLITVRRLSSTGGSSSVLSVFNPLTGNHDAIIADGTTVNVGAIAKMDNGSILAIRDRGTGTLNDANTSGTYRIGADGTFTALAGTGITTYEYRNVGGANPHTNFAGNRGMTFSSLAFYNDTNSQTVYGYGLANRTTFDGINVGINATGGRFVQGNAGPVDATNLIYRINPDSGAAVSRAGQDMPGGLQAADPLDPAIQSINTSFTYPAETPWAGTDIVAQIQVPKFAQVGGVDDLTRPTGNVTSLATDPAGGQRLYAFTDTGAVWVMNFSENGSSSYSPGDIRGFATLLVDPTVVDTGTGLPNAVAGTDFIADLAGNKLIFEQVTNGPSTYQHTNSDIDIRDLYFGVGKAYDATTNLPVDNQVRLYAFDMTTRTAKPIFQYEADSVLMDTNNSSGRFAGFFFSALDQNLWHLSDTNESMAGHGMPQLDNDARPNINGGGSLRFGFDNLNDDFNHLSNNVHDNNLDASDLQNVVGYNYLGGANGVVQSNSIDLTGFVSQDLPTLYFNYLLDTENANGGTMRDSLRVFVAGDDGIWRLVATNNFNNNNAGAVDWATDTSNQEYESSNSHYGDDTNDRRFVQQLFDTPGFRQARIDLGPWAGQENVRIRFDFSTAGEAPPDQSEIFANPGDKITDGHTITLTGLMPDKTVTTIGSALPNLTKVFEFDVAGDGVSTFGAIPIPITPLMSDTEVRDAIQKAIANEIHYFDSVPVSGTDYSLNSFPVASVTSIKFYNLTVTQSTTGKRLTLIQGETNNAPNLPVTNFGVYDNSAAPNRGQLIKAGQRSLGLGGAEGVYIDDIVIGLAERGESVGNAAVHADPLTALADNPYFQPTYIGVQRPEIVTGPYQIEVRLAREYGDTQDSTTLTKFGNARVQLNERLAEALNLRVSSYSVDISEGDTFTLSNGADTMTFEFTRDIVYSTGNIPVTITDEDFPGDVAAAMLRAINQISVNSKLKIIATNQGGQLGTEATFLPTDTVIAIHGYAAADANGGINFGPHILPIITGQDIVLGEDNGDRNLRRDQGQIVIDSNTISFSAGFGITVDAGTVGRSGQFSAGSAEGNRPKPGAVQQFPTLNTDEQIPGAVVQNNLLYRNENGILISGDTSTGAPASYSRVLNNTVYGSGRGIQVEQGAAPAILNNVLMNNSNIGLNIVGAGEVLVRGTVYQSNGTDSVGAGSQTEVSDNPGANTLFVNPNPGSFNPAAGNPNFYPLAGSSVIDSSVENQNDRALITSVKQVVGIPPSPIKVTQRDLVGQLRQDDTSITNILNNQNIRFDRGAIDRSDVVRPIATLVVPLDGDAFDLDDTETVVHLSSGRLDRFEILLTDKNGMGIDLSTVTPAQVTITENGRLLTEGEDYVFGYSATSNKLLLSPTSGEWRPDSAYEITLNNRDRFAVQVTDGLTLSDGDQFTIRDNNTVINPNGDVAVFEFDSGFNLQIAESLTIEAITLASAISDRDVFDITSPDGATTLTFEFEKVGGVTSGNVAVNLGQPGAVGSAVSASDVRDRIFDAIETGMIDLGAGPVSVKSVLDLSPVKVGGAKVQIGSKQGTVVTNLPAQFAITGVDRGVTDGDYFIVTSQGVTKQFELDSSSNLTPIGTSDVLPSTTHVIKFLLTDTADEIAIKIGDAIADASILESDAFDLVSARGIEGGRVHLGGEVGDVVTVTAPAITVFGTPGVTGKLQLTVPAGVSGLGVNNQRVTVTANGIAKTFLLTTMSNTPTTNERIVLLQDADDATQIASALAGEINSFFGSLSTTSSGNVITLGEPDIVTPGGSPFITSVDTSLSTLTQSGTGGGAIRVPFIPSALYSRETVAAQVIAAVTQSRLKTSASTAGGGTVWLDSTNAFTGFASTQINAMRDLAGNPLEANRVNFETQFTVLMPGVQLDFGDAPTSFPTLLGDNGARHTVSASRTPRLGKVVDTEVDAFAAPDSDDLATIITITGGGALSPVAISPSETTITLTSTPFQGDILTVSLGLGGAPTIRTYQLVERRTATPHIPIIMAPNEPASVLAERVASTVAADLLSINARAIVEYELGSDTVTIVSRDDEDGVGINSITFDGNVLEGMFVDPSITTMPLDETALVSFLNPLSPNGSQIVVTSVGSGMLDAWIDFNGDGDFSDAGEQVLANAPVLNGENRLNVITPANPAVAAATGRGMTWARFRISATGNQLPGGITLGGEVEDYRVQVVTAVLPEPTGDAFTTDEDTLLTVTAANNVSLNDFKASILDADLSYVIERAPTNASTFTFDPVAGTFTYQGKPDFYGTDTFTYRIAGAQTVDGIKFPVKSSLAGTVVITVNPINDAPFATPHTFIAIEPSDTNVATTITMTKAQLLTGALPQDDADARISPWDEKEQTLRVVQIAAFDSTGTRLNIASAATDPLMPDDGNYTMESYSLIGGNWIHIGTLDVTVAGREVTQVRFNPTADYNSSNPAGSGAATPSFVSTIADDGKTTLPSGTAVTPDLPGLTGEATVSIEVKPSNDPPVASPDTILAREETQQRITRTSLLGNDSSGPNTAGDENAFTNANDGAVTIVTDSTLLGLPATFSAYPLTTAKGGTVSIDLVTGDLLYDPPVDYYGEDTFVYVIVDNGIDEAIDGTRTSNPKYASATVTLSVDPVNDAPIATDKTFAVIEDPGVAAALKITAAQLLAGAAAHADPQLTFPFDETNQELNVIALTISGTTYTASGTYATAHGTVTAEFDSVTGFFVSLDYLPNLDFNSDNPLSGSLRTPETFTFTIADDALAVDDLGAAITPVTANVVETATANISIFVMPQNDSPVASPDIITSDPLGSFRDYLAMNSLADSSPVEDADLTIPAGYLLRNDANAPATANDEIARINSGSFANPNDNQLSLDPTQFPITTSLGATVTLNVDGSLQYNHLSEVFGLDTFTYRVIDQGVNESITGVRTAAPRTAESVVSILIDPTNDKPLAQPRGFRFDESIELDANGNPLDPQAVLTFTRDQLLFGNPANGEVPAQPHNFVDPLTPYDEDEQSLRVIRFIVPDPNGGTDDIVVNDVANSVGNGLVNVPVSTKTGGQLIFTFNNGEFVSGTYTPSRDYNERTPFDVTDLFSYIVADDGKTTLPGSGVIFGGADQVRDLADAFSDPVVVTLSVTEKNDPPLFDVPSNVSAVLEDQGADNAPLVLSVPFATNIATGPATALDELSSANGQTVTFSVERVNAAVPGLMSQVPTVSTSGVLTLYPLPDAFGVEVYRVIASDNAAVDPKTTVKTFTVTIDPVNDIPVAMDRSFTIDEAIELDADGNPLDPAAVLNFTAAQLLAGNASAGEQPVKPGQFDPTLAAPFNESEQTMRVVAFSIPNPSGGPDVVIDGGSLPTGTVVRTQRTSGGLLSFNFVNGVFQTGSFTPDVDYNERTPFPAVQSFSYTIADNGLTTIPGSGIPSDPSDDTVISLPERQSIAATIRINVTESNDPPLFTMPSNVTVNEDQSNNAIDITGFVTGIANGPATALDEDSATHGQSVTFTLQRIHPQIAGLMLVDPEISPTGTLTIHPAQNAFGVEIFRVTASDNDVNDPRTTVRTLTITVNPTNDAPVAFPRSFTIDEAIELDANGAPLQPASVLTFTAAQLLSGNAAQNELPALKGLFAPGLIAPFNESEQTLRVVEFRMPTAGGGADIVIDGDSLPMGTRVETRTTITGGTLEFTFVDRAFTTGKYTPAVDYNERQPFLPSELFAYVVADDGKTTIPGTNDPADTADDTVTNIAVARSQPTIVSVRVTESNDPPVFVMPPTVEITEDVNADNAAVTINAFVTGIFAGPEFALDENNPANGQNVTFMVSRVAAAIPGLMRQVPQISPNGTLTLFPSPDAYGVEVFEVQATDNDPAGDSRTTVRRFTVTVNPVNDAPVANPRLLSLAESVELNATGQPLDGPASLTFTVDQLIDGDVTLGEQPATPSDFVDPTLPYDEDEQSLRIVSFKLSGSAVVVDAAVNEPGLINGTGTVSRTTETGATVTFTFQSGSFVSGTYTPLVNYNQRTPFNPTDTMTYTVADDGKTTMPGSGEVLDLADQFSVPATITFVTLDRNDPPEFVFEPVVNVLERDDNGETVFKSWASSILPGPTSARDELQRETVSFAYVASASTIPEGLFRAEPRIATNGDLSIFPMPDAVGTATIVVEAIDNDRSNSLFVPARRITTFTVNVQPVNDAPRLNQTLIGTSDVFEQDPDFSYSVATDGTITYTLREDNTLAGGATTGFFIPFEQGLPIPQFPFFVPGLLEVFTVGPLNEGLATPGGSQVLEVSSFPTTTQRGGTLTEVKRDGKAIGLMYVPPANYNSAIGTDDGFTYSVRDDSVVSGDASVGETYSLQSGDLVEERRVVTNRVRLRMSAVNDRPSFELPSSVAESLEDSDSVFVNGFAINISGGPITALDETNQETSFTLTAKDFDASEFFTEVPVLTSTGRLSYKPAPNVFGDFEFFVKLTDDGDQDSAGRGDQFESEPVEITISVRPQNDAPVLVDNAPDLTYEIAEDGSIDILFSGNVTQPGLFDYFNVGAANESDDVVGGNQTLSLATPLPTVSEKSGTLTPIRDDANNLIGLRYVPAANFVGTDTFTYTVTDNGISIAIGTDATEVNDFRTATNTVTIGVTAINDAPVFTDAQNVTSAEDQGPVIIQEWAKNIAAGPSESADEINGSDTTVAQTVSFIITQLTGDPTLFSVAPTATIVDGVAALRYTSAPNANGVATFTARLRDNGAPTDPAVGHKNESDPFTFTITIEGVNDPPTFVPGAAVSVDEDSPAYIDVWATNISPGPADEASQTVSFEVITPDASKALFSSLPEITSGGVLRFTPASNASGTVNVEVRAIDSAGGISSSVTLPITIVEQNDAPIANADEIDTNEDAIVLLDTIDLTANDTDPDLASNSNEVLTLVLPPESTTQLGAKVTYSAETGAIFYDPTNSSELQKLAPGQVLVDTFTYSVRDAAGAVSPPAIVTVTVQGLNDAPITRNDTVSLNSTGTTIIRPLANDEDIDGTIDPAKIVITLQPKFGAISVESDGTLRYTPFASFDSQDQFRYTVADNLGQQSQQATVVVTADRLPVVPQIDGVIGTFKDTKIIDIGAVAVAVDGQIDLTSIVIVTPPEHGQLTVSDDGKIGYKATDGYTGPDSFVFTIADQAGRISPETTVTLDVVNARLQNPDSTRFADVNASGIVTAADALAIINRINLAGKNTSSIPVTSEDVGPNYYDVNGDGLISALDALQVINRLMLEAPQNNGGSGEQIPMLIKSVEVSPVSASGWQTPSIEINEKSKTSTAATPSDEYVSDVVELLASERAGKSDEESMFEALDQAFADLL